MARDNVQEELAVAGVADLAEAAEVLEAAEATAEYAAVAEAAGVDFTAVFDFSDPGVSPFAIRVKDGSATVEQGRPNGADLVLTESAETFEKTFRGIATFPDLIKSGAVQVSNMEGLAKFGSLFPMS